MFTEDEAMIRKVEELLDQACPFPEEVLRELRKVAADLSGSEKNARIRGLVLDIDDLILQVRWHLGQALLLIELYPQIVTDIKPNNQIDELIKEDGLPSKALLIIRNYTVNPGKVLSADLAKERGGGTVAGWIYHMMIDNAIYRVVAALDRLAKVLWYAAELPLETPRGKERIYFRSRKVSRIDEVFQNEHSRKLLEIASSELVKYIIGYRDDFSHELKVYSRIAGTRPTDEWTENDGRHFIIRHHDWDGDSLFVLANATYHQLVDALTPATEICKSCWMK